ncbi:PEP-CTERM sorting domain-containing protein [Candidatus Omnitrophota bacterium]
MKKLLITALACLLVMAFSSQASAALIAGSQAYAATNLSATINFNVYAPGDPDGDSPLGSIADYAYFYQINNNAGSLGLSQFTVGNPTGAPITGTGNHAGVAANPITIATDGTIYSYFNPTIAASGTSTIYLTSPWQPYMVSGSLISSGGSSDYHPIPGPGIPEPMSISLLGMGILGLLGFKRKF